MAVIIPAYQAEATILPLVRSIVALRLPLIVVDDASSDATAILASTSGAMVIRRRINGGKGMTLREGLREALKKDYSWFLTMDADGQHLASEIPRFLERARQGNAELIIGNRMSDPSGMPMERRLTNRFMSWLLSRLAGQSVPDTQCGFRLISRRLLEKVTLTSERFDIESELVVKSAWSGFRIDSVPVSSVYRRHMSFVRPFKDAVQFLRFLGRIRRYRPC